MRPHGVIFCDDCDKGMVPIITDEQTIKLICPKCGKQQEQDIFKWMVIEQND
jgi:DNA-directed RNA polymerase subunit M/transcription elongation factor TFIIS